MMVIYFKIVSPTHEESKLELFLGGNFLLGRSFDNSVKGDSKPWMDISLKKPCWVLFQDFYLYFNRVRVRTIFDSAFVCQFLDYIVIGCELCAEGSPSLPAENGILVRSGLESLNRVNIRRIDESLAIRLQTVLITAHLEVFGFLTNSLPAVFINDRNVEFEGCVGG